MRPNRAECKQIEALMFPSRLAGRLTGVIYQPPFTRAGSRPRCEFTRSAPVLPAAQNRLTCTREGQLGNATKQAVEHPPTSDGGPPATI